jgi:uncharacterized protein YeaO (DUF488 family)
LRTLASQRQVTLLYAVKDVARNHRIIADIIEGKP